MQRSLRHKAIIRAVATGATIRVADLVALTGASAVTLRRDLADLESVGAVVRTHGGVMRQSKRGTPMPFSTRWDEDQAEKRTLGVAAAALINDHESLIIDNGTTCLAVAQELVGLPLTVLALSLRAAGVLAARAGTQVCTPGGPVETDSLAQYGAAAMTAVQDFRADAVILGACSADPIHGLTATIYEDAALKRLCLAAAPRRILVMTAQKLGRTSAFRFASAAQLTHLVTSANAPSQILTAFRDLGVEVVVA